MTYEFRSTLTPLIIADTAGITRSIDIKTEGGYVVVAVNWEKRSVAIHDSNLHAEWVEYPSKPGAEQ